MERQLINQGYIIALIALWRLKMERQWINQGYIILSNGLVVKTAGCEVL